MAAGNTDSEPTQLTQPKGKDKDGNPYPPIEIPVPKREDFERLIDRVENTSPRKDG